MSTVILQVISIAIKVFFFLYHPPSIASNLPVASFFFLRHHLHCGWQLRSATAHGTLRDISSPGTDLCNPPPPPCNASNPLYYIAMHNANICTTSLQSSSPFLAMQVIQYLFSAILLFLCNASNDVVLVMYCLKRCFNDTCTVHIEHCGVLLQWRNAHITLLLSL